MAYGIYDNGAIIARIVAPFQMRSNKPIFVSDTLSLSRVTSGRSPQRWELETNLEALTSGAHKLFAHLVLHGYSATFTIIAPQNIGVVYARAKTVSTPTAVGTKGASVVAVTNNSGLIPTGTMIKFPGHTKVYMAAADLTGNGNLAVYPTLRANVNGVFNFRDDVEMLVKYDTDTIVGMKFVDGIVQDMGTVKMVEAV